MFQLDEVVREDLDLSDDVNRNNYTVLCASIVLLVFIHPLQEFFQDAALLDLSDYDSQSVPADHLQHSLSLPGSTQPSTPHVSQLSTITYTSTSSTQNRGTPSLKETVPSFKPPVSAQSSLQQQSRTSSNSMSTSQRLRSFSFTKLPSRRPCPVDLPLVGSSVEENAAKRIALDITHSNTTTATSGTTSLLPSNSQPPHNMRSIPSSVLGSNTPTHTPERSRINSLSQRELSLTPFTTPTSTPRNTTANFTPRSTATPILTPVNRTVTVTPTGSGHHSRRKFPGPAGILPKLVNIEVIVAS